MSKLMKAGAILREELDERRYFTSLLSLALQRGRLSPEAAQRIQIELLQLLAGTCKAFTGGASSSVRKETAEELHCSLLFTLGIWLKTYSEPDNALRALAGTELKEGCQLGYRRLLVLERSTRQFYRQVKKHRLTTENEVYNATLDGGISGFFKIYRPDFSAHQIHITADYPTLCFPIGYEGLEFIRLYLEGFHNENLFCQSFPETAVRRVLALHAIGYGSTQRDMVCNLCEPVLASALACALGGDPPITLTLSLRGAGQVRDMLGGTVLLPLTSYLDQVIDAVAGHGPLIPKAAHYIRAVCKRDRAGLGQMILLMAREYE